MLISLFAGRPMHIELTTSDLGAVIGQRINSNRMGNDRPRPYQARGRGAAGGGGKV